MKRRKLGCLTGGGLITLVISLIAVGVSYAVSQNRMFSPGKLNSQSSGTLIGGVTSHSDIEVNCGSCHAAPWDPTHMSDLCMDCHQDIPVQISDQSTLHGAAMVEMKGEDCRVCHTDHNGPDQSLTEYIEGNFPHELVGYYLRAHQQIDWIRELVCVDCHQDGFTDFDEGLCFSCHDQIDHPYMIEHSKLFNTRCLECHDGVETLGKDFDHAQMPFPLTGRHKPLLCENCHQGAETLSGLQDTPIDCLSCHLEDDAHQGYLGALCENCHTPEDWVPALYNHYLTGFDLTGGHDNLICTDCHADPTYQGLDPACISCHSQDEPHEGQYGTGCDLCHTTTTWDEIVFDHLKPYAQDCGSCHLPDSPIYHYPGQCSLCHNTSAWLPASFDHTLPNAGDCQACHSLDRPNNHYPGQCSICHYTSAWKPANFNHTFPLNHGGAQKTCQKCHTSSNYYAYTCYKCHEHSQSEIRKEHENVNNLENCIRCHWDGKKHDDDDD